MSAESPDANGQEMPMKARPAPKLRMGADHLESGLAEVGKRHRAFVSNLPLGPRVFLPTLAREVGGYFPQGVVVLGGSPGAGKTALAHAVSATAGCAAVVISLEMAANVLIDRHISRATGRWLSEIRSGALPPETWDKLFHETTGSMPHVGFIDGTRGGVTRKIISDAAKIARAESGSEHLLIVIDSFHSWMRGYEPGSNGARREPRDILERSLHGIGQLSSELEATIFLITEQSKAAMESDRQEASADSRVFAYISELVLMLTRDREIDADSNGEVPVRLTIGKNRHGAPGGRIELQFCGGKMSFRENPLGGRTIESASKGKRRTK
jgi:replicative DNA helicase